LDKNPVQAFKEDRDEEIRRLVARQRAEQFAGGDKEEEDLEEREEQVYERNSGDQNSSLVEAWSLAQLVEEGVEKFREGGERLREGGERLRTHVVQRAKGNNGNSPIKTRGQYGSSNHSTVQPSVLFTRASLSPTRSVNSSGASTGSYAVRAKQAAAYRAVAKPTPAKGLRKKGTRAETH
jgi:hypothetical protein